jgi:hypothetical protein
MNNTTPTRTHLSIIKLSKSIASGKSRIKHAGSILGSELKNRFLKLQDGGILVEVES